MKYMSKYALSTYLSDMFNYYFGNKVDDSYTGSGIFKELAFPSVPKTVKLVIKQ